MFFPGRIENLPPLITSAVALVNNRVDVRICAFSSSDSTAGYLKSKNVQVVLIRDKHPGTFFRKCVMWVESFWKLYKEKRKFQPDCLWLHLGHVCAIQAFAPFIRRGVLIVVHLHELVTYNKLLFMLTNYLTRKADIAILPERNRAYIIKEFSRSKCRFFTIPNRPLAELITIDQSKNKAQQFFRLHGGSDNCNRFLIYQGIFTPERCLSEIITAFSSLEAKDVGLILMGGNKQSNYEEKLRYLAASDNRIVFINHISPPYHLEITRGCHAGIALYAPTRLNNIYCAPNKIYEFAACGIGMVLPDFPGMTEIAYKNQIAVLCNPMEPESIKEAISTILACKIDKSKTAVFLETEIAPEDAYREISDHLYNCVEKKRTGGLL